MVVYARGRQLREELEQLGCEVEWYEYPMGHEVCLSEIRSLGAWIAGRLG
jgi:phospholipase/carboxylesterase